MGNVAHVELFIIFVSIKTTTTMKPIVKVIIAMALAICLVVMLPVLMTRGFPIPHSIIYAATLVLFLFMTLAPEKAQ